MDDHGSPGIMIEPPKINGKTMPDRPLEFAETSGMASEAYIVLSVLMLTVSSQSLGVIAAATTELRIYKKLSGATCVKAIFGKTERDN